MTHLSDELLEYAHLGVIDRATVRRLSAAAERDDAAICELISVAGSANGLDGEYPDPVDGLRVLLDHFAAIRQERDNLAGTVELCCLPVEGEASLCDRVRAAGDAQRSVDGCRAEAERAWAAVRRLELALLKLDPIAGRAVVLTIGTTR